MTDVHICWTDEQYEVFRREYGERWCFRCRKRRDFVHVRTASVGMSWYGPIDRIECTSCRTIDGDCFPGVVREWLEA
jgi:hypothetical protein